MRELVDREQFRALVQSLLDRALAGDTGAAGVLINRLVPALKPTAEPIRLELDGNLSDQAAAVVQAISQGLVAPSDGKTILDAVTAAAALGQVAELESRLAALEARHA